MLNTQKTPLATAGANSAWRQNLNDNHNLRFHQAQYTLTKITTIKPRRLAKAYSLKPDGTLQKESGGAMVEGVAERVTVGNLAELGQLIETLTTDQALLYGVAEADQARIVTKNELPKNPGAIARSKEFFAWPADGGVLMLDHDANERQNFGRDDLIASLVKALPALADVGLLWLPSGSSHVTNVTTGEDLTGLRGQRLYMLIENAGDIERLGRIIADRLWLSGLGWFDVSKAGSLLERTIFDLSVWQPTRLDFASGSHCVAPLEQRRGSPFINEGRALTLADVPELTTDELTELADLKKAAREAVKPAQDKARSDFVNELTSVIGDDGNTARRALDGLLFGDFPIILDDGAELTVAELLDKAARYHGRLTLDPLEPDYEHGKTVGKLYLIGGRPRLYSFAHGGRTFKLLRQPRDLEILPGSDHELTHTICGVLNELPDIFDSGDRLVIVEDGKLRNMQDVDFVRHYLGGLFQFYVMKRTPDGAYRLNQNPPLGVCKSLLAVGKGRGLRQLDAVITAPTMTAAGRIVSAAGYDPETRLFLDCDDPHPVADRVTQAAAQYAADYLMHPFESFPLCEAVDRGVLLAGLLTAAVRPVIPTAPAVAFDAPVQGSGKTLLARCVAAMATGQPPAVWPHTAGRDDEETRKRLLTALIGGDGALLIDNILGAFDSAALAAFLTSPSFTDRILGRSQSVTIPNKCVTLLTGNNLELAGDMPRRVLACRIDPKSETPFARQFDLDPFSWTMAHRQKMIAAALTVIRGFQQSGAGRAAGRMASFEEWDDLVRQPVAWLATLQPTRFADPMEAIKNAVSRDPEKESWGEVLGLLVDRFGEANNFTVAQALQPGGFTSDALHEALSGFTNGKTLTAKGVGRILKHRTGQIVDGKAVYSMGKTERGHSWRVVRDG